MLKSINISIDRFKNWIIYIESGAINLFLNFKYITAPNRGNNKNPLNIKLPDVNKVANVPPTIE